MVSRNEALLVRLVSCCLKILTLIFALLEVRRTVDFGENTLCCKHSYAEGVTQESPG